MFDQFDWTEGLENEPIYSHDKSVILKRKTSQYVENNIPGPGCDFDNFDTQILGCNCDTCQDEFCICITKYGQNYRKGKMISDYLINTKIMKPIFECNSECKCSSSCENRLVQHGITTKLEVRESPLKGLCVFSVEPIEKGCFVCEYAGEIISLEEAKNRSSKQSTEDMNYILTVKEHHKNGEIVSHVDPTKFGNIGRYINHSCSPNLSMFPVRVDNMVPKICLFTAKDISASEELTFDYGHHSSSVDKDKLGSNCKPCFCEAQDCRGYLPFEPSLYS